MVTSCDFTGCILWFHRIWDRSRKQLTAIPAIPQEKTLWNQSLYAFLFLDIFFELAMHVQTTRSPRLLNGFWCFLVQNKGEVQLVLFLSFPTTSSQLKLFKKKEQAEKVSNKRGNLLTSPSLPTLVHGENTNQKHGNTQNNGGSIDIIDRFQEKVFLQKFTKFQVPTLKNVIMGMYCISKSSFPLGKL